MPRLGLFLVFCAALASCVSTHMKQYLGKDAREIRVKDGDPVAVFDMPDGRRAFQYRWGGGTITVPTTTRTSGQVTVEGNTAIYEQRAVTTGGGTRHSEGCLITYFARWNEQTSGWVVESISYPRKVAC